MKKFLKTLCLFTLSLVLISCATVEKTPITGKWEANTTDGDKVYLFSPNGKFAYEDSSNDEYKFGSYEYLNGKLICNDESFDIVLKGRTFELDGLKFKRTTTKVVDNSASICGVWQMSDDENTITLGFSKDGAAVCCGTYYNSGLYSIDESNNKLTIKIDSDYLILNDTLYVDLFTFASFYDVEKLTRLTSEGKNQSFENLLSINGWWYMRDGSNGMSGTQYYFYENGGYWAIELEDATVLRNISGTYEFVGPYSVNLSNGNKLIFCVIDNYPFGYTI